jgi:Na+-transporting NADH:ubiquinone oxidoreductase subunit C
MRSFSNTYIYTFSAILVTIVAALLAFVALQLKPIQQKNIDAEKMQNILTAVGISSDKNTVVETYHKYITESYVINQKGEPVEGVSAFNVDLKKELAKIDEINNLKELLVEKRISPFKTFISGFFNSEAIDKSQVEKDISLLESERLLPVYVCKHSNGNTYYVFPMQGKGLWGPIWGYIALESDMNTVFGAVFDHKSETPGLGAEIKEKWFGDSFNGKKIFSDDLTFKSIQVIKKGSTATTAYNVDAISGGTITSKGVEAMLFNNLVGYVKFMENKRK